MTSTPHPAAGAVAPAASLADDHFALLGLPRSFVLDSQELEQAWRRLQAQVHPDRYATAAPAERRIAMQWASQVNEAYRTLRSPLRRARYLCELAGHPVQAESNTAMAPAFLMQQLEWREALEAGRQQGNGDGLDALEQELKAASAEIEAALKEAFALNPPDYAAAVARVREWMFIQRLLEEVDDSRP